MTYKGPKTTPKKGAEAANGVGTALSLFDGAHDGATAYFSMGMVFDFKPKDKLIHD